MAAAHRDRRAFVSSASVAAAALCLVPGRARSLEVTAEPFALDPALQQKRRETSSKVLFTEDFYFKFGKVPPPTIGFQPPGGMPFVPTARRYAGLKKFAPRVDAGLALYAGALRQAIAGGDWPTVVQLTTRAAKGVPGSAVSDLPLVLGLLSNQLVQSENDGPANANYLCHSLANELSFAVDDVFAAAQQQDQASCLNAWLVGREYIDSYLSFVNPTITEKVGDKYALLFAGARAAAAVPAAAANRRDPAACQREGAFLECLAERKALDEAP